MTATRDATVLIIGAGAAGLATAYHLERAGVQYVILEKDSVGATWAHQYRSLTLNSVKQISALPGLRIPRSVPLYPTATEFHRYLVSYARQFRLRVLEGVEVEQAIRDNGRWHVITNVGLFRGLALVAATGTWSQPYWPAAWKHTSFGGRIIHSKQYRDPLQYVQRKVLVVGGGSSAADIALDLVDSCAKVGLSVRSGVNILPRPTIPAIAWTANRLMRFEPTYRMLRSIRNIVREDYGALGLPSHPASLFEIAYHPILGEQLPHAVRAGAVHVYGGVKSIDGARILFDDGAEDTFDTVILATGYRPMLRYVHGAVELDERGYPKLDGYRSAIDRSLYCVGFSLQRALREGWLPSIKKVSAEAARQILNDRR